MEIVVGVDIGGTNTAFGIVARDGRVLAQRKIATAALGGLEELPERLGDHIAGLLANEGIPRERLLAAGVGMPGIVDPLRGVGIESTNLGWRDYPLAERLSRRLGKPVSADNDVRMYTLGEALCGAGRGFDYALGVTVGTGLAAALVVHGRLYYGGGFAAGELGHIQLPGLEEECGCGMTGCMETVVSARGMIRQAQRLLAEGQPSALTGMADAEGRMTGAELSAAHDLGDDVAVRVFRQTARWFAIGLSYVVPVLSPDALIVGGGGAKAGERLLAPLREELALRLHPFYANRLTVVPAQWNDEAGLIGSAMFAYSRLEDGAAGMERA